MKRILSFLIAVFIVFSVTIVGFAASDNAVSAADKLHELGLFAGIGANADGTPNYDLDRTPSRYEAVTMLVRLLGKEKEALAGTWKTPFTDVVDWAKPYVGYAYTNSLTSGISATKFGGEYLVSASQYITFVLRALGYDSSTDFKWDAAWELSDRIHLTSGEYNENTASFIRADVALISAAALDIKLKDSDETLYESIKASTGTSADFDAMIDEISETHKAQVTNTAAFSDISRYLVSDTSAAKLLSAEEVKSLTTQRNVKNTLTYAEAAADVDIFFRAFESAYGGYYYFGKAAFDEAKTEMTSWLRGRSTVSRTDFENALADAMDFLQDAHVGIGGVDRGIDLEYEYYYCQNQNYNADENGYYKTVNGEKWYFASFSDSRVRMERGLTSEGEVVYSPVLFCPEPDMKNSSITLKNDSGKTKTEALSWIRNESYWGGYYSDVDYNLVEEDGVAYISLRSCDNYYSETLFEYASSGSKLRDASLIIFDIRGNGGGSELYSMEWVMNFIGYGPSLPLAGGTRYSTLRTAAGFDDGSVTAGKFEQYRQNGRWIKNDIPIIVLVDEYVASAGESTLNYLRSMDNVIVVGSNTTGAQLCGNVMDLFLPNSGIYFRFGTGLGFQYNTENKDFRGYEPDIWCNPRTSLDAVMKMVERYDLADGASSGIGDSIKDVVSEKTDIVLYLTMDLETGAFHQPDPELYPGERCGMPEIDASQVWTVYKDGKYRSDFTASSANPDIAKTTIFEYNGRTYLEVRTADWGECEFYVTVDGETAKFIYTSVG